MSVVVAYHVGLPGFGGGFVGVDVFFVVSGFLITGLLLRELERSGRIDWGAFYARRVRRLLPALGVVVLTTLALGAVLLLPWKEQPALARAAGATALFSANVLFWHEAFDYFAMPGTSPLLHTWSLAVEEQFYFAWPLAIAGLYRLTRGRAGQLAAGLALACAVSFVSATSAFLSAPASFFLAHARAWEFGAGAMMCVAGPWLARAPGRAREAAGWSGLVLLAATTVGLGEGPGFPIPAALLPVAATALLVAAGFGADASRCSRLLSTAPLRTIGRWSYSWYLWHWPLLAMARAAALEESDPVRDVLIGLGSLALAGATVRWVEDPIRFGRPGPFATTRGSLFAGMGITATVLAAAIALDASARAGTERVADQLGLEEGMTDVVLDADALKVGAVPAAVPADAPRLLLWGDSHAAALTGATALAAASQGIGLDVQSLRGCLPIGTTDGPCRDFNDEALASLRSSPRTQGVVLIARWGRLAGFALSDGIAVTAVGKEQETRIERGLFATLQKLQAAGRRTLVVAPVPELEWPGVNCLLRRTPEECARPRSGVDAQRAPAVALLSRVVARFPETARLYDGIEALCSKASCAAARDGHALFLDTNHLAARGSQLYMAGAAPAMRWLVER
ncbi:MAG: acyltransferase [Vicinamibacteria bacterium]|nr:acyltransferase [Vicinamibacteria bacterium]